MKRETKFELSTFTDPDQLAEAAANLFLNEVEKANRAGKQLSVALSGGRIAHNLFNAIVTLTRARGASLQYVHFFWADERCVPPDDAESNYKTAKELLFVPLKISASQIHRIRGEDAPEVAAEKAAKEIFDLTRLRSEGQPVLDLIFLGIGPDGHTASLFPGEPESTIVNKNVYRYVNNSPKPPKKRITLGYPAIAAAQHVVVLVSGSGKEKIFNYSLQQVVNTPFARVLRSRALTRIFSDLPTG